MADFGDPLAADPEWMQIAELLCSGLAGHALLAELRARFPHSKRADVYRAVAFAWTHQQAGWLADQLELETVQRKGRGL